MEKRPSILIIDDEAINIRILAETLQKEYHILVANNAEAGIAVAKSKQPDLILLDVVMPDMDGHEVCRQLKSNPQTRNIPVIFVTAKNDVIDEEAGLRLGAADYIIKPFYLPIVCARIQNQINLKLKTDLLEALAMIDGLTNTSNRRRFDEALDQEWKRAARNDQALSMIMIDVDFFKAYNDEYGHSAGDSCLKRVAAALSQCITRPADLVARYGGEEFVVILPATQLEGATNLAEKMRAAVEALGMPHVKSSAAPVVTISLGVATKVPTGQRGNDTAEAAQVLCLQADEMLYKAKAGGRNRVCSAL